MTRRLVLPLGAGVVLLGLTAIAGAVDLKTVIPDNPAAYIPPSCWTRTTDAAGRVNNPCSTCHVASNGPNYVNDGALQLAYDFPDVAATNPWTNLFKDRGPAIGAQTDAAILSWVRTDNYPDLARKLATPPADWDVDGDGRWGGYVPDIAFDFDDEGFDRGPGGIRTGWRAYAYRPLPGGFWPTNGSADDVAIRLPAAFRERADGTPDDRFYAANLAIVEALVKQADVATEALDEAALGVDLDGDGRLGTARLVRFAFDATHRSGLRYVGRAGQLLAEDQLHDAPGLFPEGTEFVHTVRYLDVAADGAVVAAPRLKELRYAVKTRWRSYFDLQAEALGEIKEASDYPDRLRRVFGDSEHGVGNGQGWRYQGFIEAADGALRPQSYEESLTCVGCHGGVGRTVDSGFSYGRKLDAPASRNGWYHWSQKPLGDIADDGEYAGYLERNGAGDEFRANDEVLRRFFTAEGKPEPAAMASLERNIAALVMPSADRALALDKAYRVIVGEQSFVLGRVPLLHPLDQTVHRSVEPGQPTGIADPAS